MALSKEQINKLMALPTRQRGAKASGPDTSIRDYQTWFKLGQKMVDENTRELIPCSNPNCQDPRATSTNQEKKGIVVVRIKGQYICRYCFLTGYLLENETQTQLSVVANGD